VAILRLAGSTALADGAGRPIPRERPLICNGAALERLPWGGPASSRP